MNCVKGGLMGCLGCLGCIGCTNFLIKVMAFLELSGLALVVYGINTIPWIPEVPSNPSYDEIIQQRIHSNGFMVSIIGVGVMVFPIIVMVCILLMRPFSSSRIVPQPIMQV